MFTSLQKKTVFILMFFYCNASTLQAMETNLSKRTTFLGLDKTPTDLHYAAQEGNIEKINLLIDNGADINSTCCHFNNTPLHIVTWFGHSHCITPLIQRGAQIDIPNCHGSTPIHLAAWKNEASCLTELLNHNANIFKENSTGKGNTPLYLAAKAGSVECLRLILKYIKHDTEHLNQECAGDKSTAIQASAARQRTQCYWDLLVAGADYTKPILFGNYSKSNAELVYNNYPLKRFLQWIEYRGTYQPPRFKGDHTHCFSCTQNFKLNDVIMTIKLCSHTLHAYCFEDYCIYHFMEINKTNPELITFKKNDSDKECAHRLKTSPINNIELANKCPKCAIIFDPQHSAEFSVFLQ